MMSKNTVPRILTPPKMSFFLFGPRGTGKTTWLQQIFPLAYRIDLLDEALFQSYLADIGLFAAELRALEDDRLVIVDEVQRLPALLNYVHQFIERKRLRFILCGSSARKLKQAGTNLLAGRAVRRHMHPFVPEELGEAFVLDEVLQWGSLPVIWNAPDKREALEAYTTMYLKEEIQAEALVRNLPGFARFLPVAALFQAQVLNISSLARDASVARTTIAGYLEVIEDTLLTFRLPAFDGRLRVRERKHPKLYWADPGLPRSLKKQFGPPSAEEKGHLFEGWIASLLRSYRDYRDLFDEWAYWAPVKPSKVEVDFLLRRDDQLVAIEAKCQSKISQRTFVGLRAVESLKGLRRRILVYLGERRLKTEDGIEVLPLRSFLDLIESGELFP